MNFEQIGNQMKKRWYDLTLIVIGINIFTFSVKAQPCNANFSSLISNDTAWFINRAVFSGNHYYWNFGDGSTSFEFSPIHIFPESGEYMVTLYMHDSLNTCRQSKDTFITIVKPSKWQCTPGFNYEVVFSAPNNNLIFYDLSTRCELCKVGFDTGIGGNLEPNTSIHMGKANRISALWLNRQKLYVYNFNEPNQLDIYREYFKTWPYNLKKEKTYDSCSANFEYSIEYKPEGALTHFKAMNPDDVKFNFSIQGYFPVPNFYSDTATFLFPYYAKENRSLHSVYLFMHDTIRGCKDTLIQTLTINNLNYTFKGKDINAGVNELNTEIGINVYPNPFKNLLHVECLTPLELEIMTLEGSCTKRMDMNAGYNKLNLTDLSPRIYILKFNQNHRSFFHKLVKIE